MGWGILPAFGNGNSFFLADPRDPVLQEVRTSALKRRSHQREKDGGCTDRFLKGGRFKESKSDSCGVFGFLDFCLAFVCFVSR